MCSGFTAFFVYTAPFMLATTFTAELETFTGVLGRTLLSTFLLGVCYLAINSVAKTFENPMRGDSRQARAAPHAPISTPNPRGRAARPAGVRPKRPAPATATPHATPMLNTSRAPRDTQAAAALPMQDMCEAMAVELGDLFREPIPPVAGIIDAQEEARRGKGKALGSIPWESKERRGGKAVPIKALKVRTIG